MEKNSFLESFEEVMGVHFTKYEFIIGLLMVVAGLLMLQVGEYVENILLSLGK